MKICGVDDRAAVGQFCKWPSPKFTWTVVADLSGFPLPRSSVVNSAALAWSYWSDVCGIIPQYVEPTEFANVVIGLQTIGPGNVLADCEMPCGATMQSRMRMRLDTAEAWTTGDNPPPNKINLPTVLAHEEGHALGFEHEQGPEAKNSLMGPYYSSSIRKPQYRDILRARASYGEPVIVNPPPPPPPSGFTKLEFAEKDGQVFVSRNGGVFSPFKITANWTL
jgi:hypothetical protein